MKEKIALTYKQNTGKEVETFQEDAKWENCFAVPLALCFSPEDIPTCVFS